MNQPQILDISIPVRPGIAVWPGDQEYELRIDSSQAEVSDLNIGSATLSFHTGTHIDAPFHFLNGGATAGELDVAAFMGPAVVIHVPGKDRIQVRDFEQSGFPLPPRMLLRTDAWTDHSTFPREFPVIESYVPAFLSERGVRLLGVDVPSVDPVDSKELLNHHALASRGIHILESLDLRAAEPGLYELIALPLRLDGADASPCRAILIRR